MDPSGTPVEPGKLFVGGLSWETQEEGMKAYFEQFGEVADCIVMREPLQPREMKKNRGFGFVTFKDPEVVKAVLAVPQHDLDNKKIDPKPATIKNATNPVPHTTQMTQAPQGPVKKIFIGGLASGTTEEDVKMYFSDFGNVTEVDLKVDRVTHRLRGFGFVGFDSEEVVQKLVQVHFHQINGKTVEAKVAEPRDSTPQQSRGMGRMNTMGPGYQHHYDTSGYGRGAVNGGQYGQQYNYGGSGGYGYGSYGQGMAGSGSGAYNYGYPHNQFGGYYGNSDYSRTQGGSGDSRGVESGYSNYAYGQQQMTSYPTGQQQMTSYPAGQQQMTSYPAGQQQMTSYPQDASAYTAGRSGYATAPESHGQQTGAYSGEYSHGSNQQQRGYPGAPYR